MTIRPAAEAYKHYLETLSPEAIASLTRYVAPQVRFADPFQDVTGLDAMQRIFQDMFDTVSDVKFAVSRMAIDGETALMVWRFSGIARGRSFVLEGMSQIIFDDQGRVTSHIDHWDSATQFYMKLPVIGWLLSMVRRRVAAH